MERTIKPETLKAELAGKLILDVRRSTDRAKEPVAVPGVELSHVGEPCSFDAFLRKYGLTDPALSPVRGSSAGSSTPRRPLSSDRVAGGCCATVGRPPVADCS